MQRWRNCEGKGCYNSEKLALDGVLLRIEKDDFKFNNNVLFDQLDLNSRLREKMLLECRLSVTRWSHYKNEDYVKLW